MSASDQDALTIPEELRRNPDFWLDLSGADLPSWYPRGWPVRVPLVQGAHHKEWDVLEKGMPADFRAFMLAQSEARGDPPDQIRWVKRGKAIGVDRFTMPHGAVVTRADTGEVVFRKGAE